MNAPSTVLRSDVGELSVSFGSVCDSDVSQMSYCYNAADDKTLASWL